jgi:hypothetical protein
MEKRASELRDEIKDMTKKVGEVSQYHDDEASKVKLRLKRTTLYYNKLNGLYSRENSYWRNVYERMLTREGEQKTKSLELLSTIARLQGFTRQHLRLENAVDDEDIKISLQLLIDELKESVLKRIG